MCVCVSNTCTHSLRSCVCVRGLGMGCVPSKSKNTTMETEATGETVQTDETDMSCLQTECTVTPVFGRTTPVFGESIFTRNPDSVSGYKTHVVHNALVYKTRIVN